MIRCTNVVKQYKEMKALNEVSFEIRDYGCVGFLGPNGAGKTTLIRILTGLSHPSSGEVYIVGKNIRTHQVEIRKEIGYCPQSPVFYNYMTGLEWMKWVGALFNMDSKEIQERAEELLKLCNVWEARNRKIGGYSGGMKQRLGIAQALMNQPKLLILDEPVSALDPAGRYDVLMLIEKLKTEMTIFMSTHILDDVERVADHIMIINKGSVILSESMETLMNHYIEPIIQFTLQSGEHDLTPVLKNIPWISEALKEGNRYKVYTTDIQMAQKQLPRILVGEGAILENYAVTNGTLEDIFLKVVNQ